MKLFDSHSHYNDEKFDEDRETIIKEIKKAGIKRFVIAGYNTDSSKKAVTMAKNIEGAFAICGISPNDIEESKEKIDRQIENIENLIKKNKENNTIVAVGEIGLDYHWNQENKQMQRYAFIGQIKLAKKHGLPIVIHTREAIMDTLEIIRQEKMQLPGVFHCCPLNPELVKEALKLGFYISIAGPVTFKNARNAREVIKRIPLDKLLVETDSPYLSPEPRRGKRNDSRNLIYIIEKIAEFKQLSKEEIAKQTYENANNVFHIDI